LPLVTAYALARREPRTRKSLYKRRGEALRRLEEEYRRTGPPA
jgi:hypothetical protein